MKKSFRRSVLASTVLLAIAGSIIGCAQPVTPQVDKTKVNTKDIFEKQLDNSIMRAESVFGKNIIYFTDVNYANDYALYRFGPMDDSLKGFEIKISDPTTNTGYDGFVVEDKISDSNYMEPGHYTYKLIAKSKINSARAATPDLSIDASKDAANQDYWANPNIDVVYIPSKAEVSFTVPKENMLPYMSQMPLTKEEVKFVKYPKEDKSFEWKLIPKANKDGVTIFAEYEDDIHKLLFESKDKNSKKDNGFVTNTKDETAPITVPTSSALNGTWNIYAKRTAGTDFTSYYRDSEKILLDTITVDVPYPKADFLVTAVTVPATGKENAKYGLTWKVKTEVADLYNFSAKRAVKTVLKSPSVSDATDSADPTIAEATIYKDLKDVTFTTPIKSVSGDTTTFTVYDEGVVQGEQYVYFWTFTPKDPKRNIVTGATESTEIALRVDYNDIKLITVTKDTFKCTVTNNSDNEFKTGNIKFTSKILDSTDTVIPHDRLSLVSISRVAYDASNKVINETVINGEYFYDVPGGYSVISVEDNNIPFKEDIKNVVKYGYKATLKDSKTGKVFADKNIYTTHDTEDVNYVTAISKFRYEVKNVTVNKVKNITPNSLVAEVVLSVDAKKAQYDTTATLKLDTISVKIPEARYTIREQKTDKFVTDGKLATDVTFVHGKTTDVTINLSSFKLVPGQNYDLFISGTDKASEGNGFKFSVPAK